MWHSSLLLCLALLVPEYSDAFREDEGAGFKLRWHKAREHKLNEAFRKLRESAEKEHRSTDLSKTTKSATPPPPSAPMFMQLSAGIYPNDHIRGDPMSEFETSNSSEGFLFTIFTDSQFYDTRLKGVLNTWAKELPPSRFMAVSDKKREYPDFEHDLYEKSELPGSDVEETRCPHGHGKGGCCKVIESQILAQQRMEKDPSLEWAFFSDDDVYLQPNAVAAAVRAEAKKYKDLAGKPLAFGIFGCGTRTCSGLCGGGGFALNRLALQALAQDNPAKLLNEEMAYCTQCEEWADQASSMLWKEKGITLKTMKGLNGWFMEEDVFKRQLKPGGSRLLYHYMHTANQMQVMHELFTGEKASYAEKGPCLEFEGHKACAASNGWEDVPYTPKPVTYTPAPAPRPAPRPAPLKETVSPKKPLTPQEKDEMAVELADGIYIPDKGFTVPTSPKKSPTPSEKEDKLAIAVEHAHPAK